MMSLLKLLYLCAGLGVVTSFQTRPDCRFPTPRFATSVDDQVEGAASLNLAGSFDLTSKNLPKVKDEDFSAFLEENYYLFASAGGKREMTQIELTPEMLTVWKEACSSSGAEQPDGESDKLIQVRTGGISFPGLKVESLVKIGVKKIYKEDSNKLYEFTLLGDEQEVKGLKPVVWIYEKLTGANEKDSNDRQSTSSLTTVIYNDVNDSKITFSINSQLMINVFFPAFLLKILPTNKEKAEESGGKSLTSVLKKDVIASMTAFEKAYIEKFS